MIGSLLSQFKIFIVAFKKENKKESIIPLENKVLNASLLGLSTFCLL